jgi:hypothetical protein
VFLVNSRSSLVTATPEQLSCFISTIPGHPFSQSYGVNLPSSLTRVISLALVSSTCLPVSVCGTVRYKLASGFSWRTLSLLHLRSLLNLTPAGAFFSDGFSCPTAPTEDNIYQRCCSESLSASPLHCYRLYLVLEYTPVVHRLPPLPGTRLRPD